MISNEVWKDTLNYENLLMVLLLVNREDTIQETYISKSEVDLVWQIFERIEKTINWFYFSNLLDSWDEMDESEQVLQAINHLGVRYASYFIALMDCLVMKRKKESNE